MSLIWRAAAARVSDLSRDPLIFIVVVGLILAVPTSLTAQPPIFLNGSAVTETPVPATLDGYTKTWLEPQVVESEQELQIDNLFPVKIVGRPRFDRATQRIELRSLKSAFPAIIDQVELER